MECEVAQGSCLGPLLFSLFINDLQSVIMTADIILYAADTASVVSVNLQNNLSDIEIWALKNRLVLNAGKTKSMLIGSQKKVKAAQPLSLRLSLYVALMSSQI